LRFAEKQMDTCFRRYDKLENVNITLTILDRQINMITIYSRPG
jgi:hypothetical protein